MTSKVDWMRLSNVETASGIEVLYAAKLFRDKKFLHKVILKHALDEYRHSSIFRSYAKKFQIVQKRLSSAQALLGDAGLANSPLKPNDKNILNTCCYLYVGEYRAIDFNNQTKKIIPKNSEILNDIMEIEKDEERHAEGVKKFLKTNKFYKYIFYLLKFKFKYKLQRITKAAIVGKLQSKTTSFFAVSLFKLIPASLFDIKNKPVNLKEALVESKSM